MSANKNSNKKQSVDNTNVFNQQQQQNPMIFQGGFQQPMMMQQQPYQNPMMMMQGGFQQPMMVQGGFQQPMMIQGYQQPMIIQNGFQQQPMIMQGGYQQQMVMQGGFQQPMMMNHQPMMMQNPVNPIMMQNPVNQVNHLNNNTNNSSKSKKPVKRNVGELLANNFDNIGLNEDAMNDDDTEEDDDIDIDIAEVNINKNKKNNKASKANSKEKKDNSFNSSKNGSNVITSIVPKDNNHANFNNETNPDEVYIVTCKNGNTNEYKASDININALESHKIIYEHNLTIVNPSRNGVLYARCSSPNNISIQTQITNMLLDAKQKNIRLIGCYIDDGVSGRFGNNLRKGELGYWSDYIKENCDDILIYSVDRLTRHLLSGMQFLETMASHNITIHFVNNKINYASNISAMHKSMIQQELQTAEKYSNDTSEKILGSQRRLKAEGHYVGGGHAKYGLKRIIVDGIRKQVTNINEQDIITKIKEKYYDICENYENSYKDSIRRTHVAFIRYIINWCDNNNIKNRLGNKFTEGQIKKIIDI